MKLLKTLQKSVKAHHLLLLGVVVAGIALYVYSSRKSSFHSGMTNMDMPEDMPMEMGMPEDMADSQVLVNEMKMAEVGEMPSSSQYKMPAASATNGVKPSAPLGHNETHAAITGIQGRSAGLSNCAKQAKQDPASLLPKDENSEWARLNPSGNGTLDNVNLLKSGYHIGIDTIGNTLRNANLQVRSEPANPQVNVGPWNNTTIAPDLMRVPLEIGCGPQ